MARSTPFLAAAAALALAAGQASAATVLSAGGDNHCGASTCFDSHGTYAITFSAASFGGPVDISKLLLARSILGNLDSHFFSLNFQLKSHQLASWGDWNMSSVGGDELSFTGSDLFWNPADGDLILVLDLVDANGEKLQPDGKGGWYAPAGGGSGFAAAPPARDDSQGYDGGYGGGYGEGSGEGSVVVDIPFPPKDDTPNGGAPPTRNDPPPPEQSRAAAPAPEPAAWALMLGGFGLVGASLRRRGLKTA